jgi:hypothetical protein
VFMYATHGSDADYQKILQATYAIYPDFEAAYLPALQAASVGK